MALKDENRLPELESLKVNEHEQSFFCIKQWIHSIASLCCESD